jgi:beta-glucosidase
MEGAGEDPFLGSCIAAARVKGFQGDNLSDNNTILSCAKHLAAYGQVEAAKEYNQTTISERYLRTVVLPPFKAACDAGAATVMNAFNDFDGIPCSGNKFLVTDILKNEWGFKGFTISDYNSFEEMINWRVVKDRKGAAELAMNAASDMDMMSMVYVDHLGELVEEGKISEEQIDASVRRILSMKFKLGLFDDPYKYFDEKRRDSLLLHPGHRKAAREMAQKSMVLLKNKNNLLPLAKNKYKTIAVIGPSAHNRNTLKGNWMGMCDTNDVVTILEGIKNKVDKTTKVLYAWGCNEYEHTSDKAFNNALETAQKADLVILAIGENWWMSGEGASRADINLGGRQTELAKAIKKQGKPVVTVLINGRPVIFHWIKNNIPAILEAWLPGTEGGDAVADILFGDYNPAGKLPVTFPYHVGQIPVYYSYKETGRPFRGEAWGVARYQDIPNTPLYPFGYGLSYTTFQYSELKLNKQTIGFSDTLTVSVEITNTGNYKGVEIVQLYISDLVASVTPPVKLLKGFKRVSLEPGETKEVIFNISTEQLKYWNKNMEYKADPGEFEVMAGTNSDEGKKASFILK